MLQQVHEASCGPVFGGGASKNDAVDPGVHQCPCAHRAGFFGHIKLAVCEPPIPDGRLCLGDGQNFRVGGCVLELFDLVVGSCDDSSLQNNDGAHRDFLLLPRSFCHAQSFSHEEFVALEVDQWLHEALICWRRNLTNLSGPVPKNTKE